MVSYKAIMKSSFVRKPIRSTLSSYSTFKHAPTASLPFKLKFESSAICNLKCKMCPLNVGLKRKQGFLKFSNFKYVFDQINPAYLNLTGIGEPFLNPDIFRIVQYAKRKKAMVKFDTNATLLNKEDIHRILRTNIDVLSNSVDGVDSTSYENIRIGSNFKLITENIKNLVKERNRMKSPTQIHMFFILQEKNVDKLSKFIEIADELGVDYIAGSFVVNLGDNDNKVNKLADYRKNIGKITEETREAIKQARAEVSIEPLLEYLNSSKNKRFYNEDKPCFMPWYSTFITWDGWVNPCDFSCDNEVVFGNAFKEPFKKVWNNKKIQEFRIKLLRQRTCLGICKECGVDETYIQKEFEKINKIPILSSLQYK